MSGVFRQVIWNQTIPDSLRGRLASIELLSYSVGPTLGNFEAGVVASLFSVRMSIVSGGVLCVVGCVLCAIALPAFRALRRAPSPSRPPGERRELSPLPAKLQRAQPSTICDHRCSPDCGRVGVRRKGVAKLDNVARGVGCRDGLARAVGGRLRDQGGHGDQARDCARDQAL